MRKEPPMLVLSRHRDESIMIGDDIVVTIVDIRGDKVRLGIDAPSDIPVHRQEVYEAIQRENRKDTRREFPKARNRPRRCWAMTPPPLRKRQSARRAWKVMDVGHD